MYSDKAIAEFSYCAVLTASLLAVSGEPLRAALCGVCPLKFSWIYLRLPRGPVCVQCAQV